MDRSDLAFAQRDFFNFGSMRYDSFLAAPRDRDEHPDADESRGPRRRGTEGIQAATILPTDVEPLRSF